MAARLAIPAIPIALLAVALSGRPGLAQPDSGPALLDRAQSAVEGLRYEEAAELLDRAWRAGGNDPDRLARLFRLTGEVAVTLGQDDGAEQAFQRLLALSPDATLPDGTSPKIAARLEAARNALAGRRLRLAVERRGSEAVAIILSDPLDMVGGARLRGAPERSAARDPASTIMRVPLPATAGPDARVEIVDRHGNVLVEQAPTIEAGASTGEGHRPAAARPRVDLTEAPPSAPLFARGWIWTAAAGGLGATGLFFGLRSESAQDDLDALNRNSAEHDFRDALDVEDRLRRDALIANVAFAAAGAAAVTAAVLWVRQARRPRAARAVGAAGRAGPVFGWTFEF